MNILEKDIVLTSSIYIVRVVFIVCIYFGGRNVMSKNQFQMYTKPIQ